MNIINYKDIDTIIPAHDTMIYCTCAEKNQTNYLEKINVWFNRYKHLDGDFYVFNDGHILEENKQIEFDDRIIFVEFDENYGRPDSYSAVFPGWKRSFCYAMKLSLKYEYFCHIENDTFIKDINLFNEKLKINGLITAPICINYNWIESACFIMNDKQIRQNCFEYFNSKERQYETSFLKTD